jgi:NADH-quinone oxidoreductase subunit E
MELETVDRIIDNYSGEDGILIQVLQDVQAEFNWLPQEAVVRVCDRLGIPLTQAYSVASFYKTFSLVPRGRHVVNICMGTACHVRGAPRVLDKVEEVLGIQAGETTPDLRFSLERVNCLGCCALGPVIVIDEEAHGKLTLSEVEGILDSYE